MAGGGGGGELGNIYRDFPNLETHEQPGSFL